MIVLAISSGSSNELPNFISLLLKFYADSPFLKFLHHWEVIFFSIVVATFLSIVFFLGTKKRELIPEGLQNFLEWFFEVFQDIVIGVLGKEGKKFVPFLGTLFIYILTMNLIGMIPLMKPPSASINTTTALSICVFVVVQYLNLKNFGIKGFIYHLLGSPKDAIGWMLAPLMFPIELLTQLSRPVTLALRLFGNILGEKILIGFFTFVSASFLYFFPVQLPFVFLGLLTSVMQAAVFTLLSTIYILLAMPHPEEKH